MLKFFARTLSVKYDLEPNARIGRYRLKDYSKFKSELNFTEEYKMIHSAIIKIMKAARVTNTSLQFVVYTGLELTSVYTNLTNHNMSIKKCGQDLKGCTNVYKIQYKTPDAGDILDTARLYNFRVDNKNPHCNKYA